MEQACSLSPFCLGMHEFYCEGQRALCARGSTHKEMVASEASACQASSSQARAPPTSERFSEFVHEQELAELGKGLVPANTSKCTKWALKTFERRKTARNQRFPCDHVPDELFQSNDPSVLSVHLTRFVVEARKATGEHYPPSSLHQLLCGLLRHMREINPNCPNFLDNKDVRFQQLHHSLDVASYPGHSQLFNVAR